MSSGQSLRNGNSVEPGLPNTLAMPNASSRSSVACLTLIVLLAGVSGLPDNAISLDAGTNPGSHRRGSPRRDTLHGRLTCRIRSPQLHPGAALVRVDAEFAALEQRLDSAITEFLWSRSAVQLRRELDQESGLHRAMKDQARITLDLGDIVAVIVNAMAVEGQRRIAKQQHGIGHVRLAVLGDGLGCRGSGRNGRLAGRDIPVDDILS